MKIGLVWHCAYPWDVRLEKFIKALGDRGHRICLICRAKRGFAREERNGNLCMHRVGLTRAPWLRPLDRVAAYPLFFNPVWIEQTLGILRREGVDLILVRDLPLGLTATWLGRPLQKPVILDMAENYPAALIAYKKLIYQPFLLGNGWLPRAYERMCLPRMDHILVVADEQRRRLVRLGVQPEKISVVGNTPERSFYSPGDDATEGHERQPAASPNLLYVGYLDPHRGVDLVVRAVPKLAAEFPGLRVTLIGDGTARRPLIELIKSLGLESRIDLPGWVEFSKIPAYIRQSSLCLIPHLRSEHTETTLPNKLFEYMALGRPIVATDCAPIKRIIDEVGCGLTFRSGDIRDFKTVVSLLLRHPNRESMGENGRRAVQQKYNWDIDRQMLVDAVERVARC